MKAMKTKRFILIIGIFLAVLFGVLAVTPVRNFIAGRLGIEHTHDDDILFYQCPMHPQITSDQPGECPICHMRLRPVRQQNGAHQGHQEEEQPQSATAGSSRTIISEERQRLIGIRTAAAVRKNVTREIRTSGVVAFDPDLQVAIREYLTIGRADPGLRQAAIARLKILGMGEDEIHNLERNPGAYSGLSAPGSGNSVWIYASVYESDMDSVHPGMAAVIRPTHQSGKRFNGIVRSISPNINTTTRTMNARIEVFSRDPDLRPSSYMNVTIQAGLGRALTVPSSAVIDTGERQIVYVVENGTGFSPREITAGPESGQDTVVLSGLQEGELVVTDATFLVDSESQIQSAGSGHRH